MSMTARKRRTLLPFLEAAEYLGITERKLRRLRVNQRINCYKIERTLHFDTDDLDDYLDQCFEPARVAGEWAT